jgi:hypothetical protein
LPLPLIPRLLVVAILGFPPPGQRPRIALTRHRRTSLKSTASDKLARGRSIRRGGEVQWRAPAIGLLQDPVEFTPDRAELDHFATGSGTNANVVELTRKVANSKRSHAA